MRIVLLCFLSIIFIPLNASQLIFEGMRAEEHIFEKVGEIAHRLRGYVKYETYSDTRRVFATRNDQYLLFPLQRILDPTGRDINKVPHFQMVAIESRLRNEWSKKLSDETIATAVIEGDFFGTQDQNELLNVYRLRYAYFEVQTRNYTILGGQGLHPTTIRECYPDTVSFNNGSPIEPLARNPVFIFTFHKNEYQLICGAASQAAQAEDGPEGLRSKYIRDGFMPDLHIQFKYKSEHHLFGLAFDIKRIRPRTVTATGFATKESLVSSTIFSYYSYFHPHFNFSAKAILSENASELSLMSGFAVHSIDPVTDIRTYRNTRSVSGWIDIAAQPTSTVMPGLFAGFSYNIGATGTILPDVVDEKGQVIERRQFGFAPNAAYVIRISPRVRFHHDPFVLGLELEQTGTAFGIVNEYGVVKNTTAVFNTRFLFAVYYLF